MEPLFTYFIAGAHGRLWHDADDLAYATTLVRNLGVNCRAGKVCLARSHQPPRSGAGRGLRQSSPRW